MTYKTPHYKTDANEHIIRAFSILMNSAEIRNNGVDIMEISQAIEALLGPEFCERNKETVYKFTSALSSLILERNKQNTKRAALRKKLS